MWSAFVVGLYLRVLGHQLVGPRRTRHARLRLRVAPCDSGPILRDSVDALRSLRS